MRRATPGPSSTPASRRTRWSLRTAALLADATTAQRLLARAVMNGETTDPAGWRTMFPTLFGSSATGDAAELDRSEAILEASLAVADRGEQVRSQVRGALIEEVTAQLLARRVGPARGPARAADPVRRRPGRDPPVRRDGRTRRRGRGVRLQVGRARDQRRRPPPARRRANARRRRGRAARGRAGRLRRPAGRATSGSAARPRRTRGPRSCRSRRSTRSAGRASDERPRARQLLRAVPRPLRRGRARRPDPHVGPAALRAGPRLAITRRAAGSGGRGTPSAASPGSSARRRSRSSRRSRSGRNWSARRPVVGWRRVWARRRTEFHDAEGALVAWVHIDWVLLDDRGAPTRIPPEFDAVFGAPQATFGLARVDLGEVPPDAGPLDVHGPAAGARPDGPRQQRGLRGLARRGGHRGRRRSATRAIPRLVRLEYARAAEPAARFVADAWPDDGGWVCRVADADGSDLLRSRLEPLGTGEPVVAGAGAAVIRVEGA